MQKCCFCSRKEIVSSNGIGDKAGWLSSLQDGCPNLRAQRRSGLVDIRKGPINQRRYEIVPILLFWLNYSSLTAVPPVPLAVGGRRNKASSLCF